MEEKKVNAEIEVELKIILPEPEIATFLEALKKAEADGEIEILEIEISDFEIK
jgi:hypothetical protein